MTDYTELKPLLDACRAENVDDPREFRKAVEALFDVCTVETISGLITESEQLARVSGCHLLRAQTLEVERDQLKAENEALRKRIDDMSPFKGAPLNGPDLKCLACGGYHYGLQGLPCPNMRITASAAMGKGEQS